MNQAVSFPNGFVKVVFDVVLNLEDSQVNRLIRMKRLELANTFSCTVVKADLFHREVLIVQFTSSLVTTKIILINTVLIMRRS